jgi:hypothetical protein
MYVMTNLVVEDLGENHVTNRGTLNSIGGNASTMLFTNISIQAGVPFHCA